MNPCGGRLSQTSKSSGARRFLPIVDGGDNVSGGDETCLLSGVRALKTGGGWVTLRSGVFDRIVGTCVARRSGVLGRANEEGPETVR